MPGCELFLEYASGKVRLRNGFDKECVAEVTRGTRSASKKIQHVVRTGTAGGFASIRQTQYKPGASCAASSSSTAFLALPPPDGCA